MEYLQMKQKDFAAKIGISEASLSGVFNGRTRANNRHVEGIHNAFPQINLNWLMFGTGEMLNTHQIEQSPTPSENATVNNDFTPSTNNASATNGTPEGGLSIFSAPTDKTSQTSTNPAIAANNSFSNELMQELIYLRELRDKNLLNKKVRKVLEIRVFFDDGTYESFTPSSK